MRGFIRVASTLVAVVCAIISCDNSSPDGARIDTSTTTPPTGGGATGTHDWTRFGWNAARTNASPDPTGIDSANVGTLTRQQVTIDGIVDASPIYLHGVQVRGASHDVFFVTTTYGKTIAIDANDGSILWTFTPPTFDALARTSQITTATPVADPNRQFIYAASPDGNIRKLSVATGAVEWTTSITLLPTREKIASPLNVDRGHVIATTGGYIGDAPPYQGHVAVIDAASGALLHVWNSLCSDRAGLITPSSCPQSGSAMWGRAGAVVDSATGDIFVTTGNGLWDGQTNWGDATIELDANATRIVANYTPTNTRTLNNIDADLGSTSPVLLASGVIAQGGKDGQLRVLNRSVMLGTTPHQGQEAQIVPTPSSNALFTAPAVWRTPTGTWVFVADGGATQAFTYAGGKLQPAWKANNPGTSPVLAGGLLYISDLGGGLRVYQPTTGQQIARLVFGASHWNSPIVVDGKIAVPEGNANDHATSGKVNIFRLP